ncbi:hypothetical protein Leryth_007945 [Lithospermum erythrorhizon]|nr:hypothetical protein Leryth_007945 [Lithospermum erythrorhizon]
MFGCFNRKFKISETEAPPDVKGTFSRYVDKGSSMMTIDQFHKFLVEYQHEEGVSLDDVERIMHEVHQRRHHLNLPMTRPPHSGFALEEFFYFLFQDDLNPPIRTEVHHDMTAPLQHYFIYTGHNSYLTGNQLSSDCSEIPIIRALQRGVRGIELDLWPNSAKDNIHVLHGRTLTTPVLLKNCLKSIKEHAFVTSPYPVIITLEDHLTPFLQAKAAEMVIKIFGDMLYYPEKGYLEEFPSPDELKHRIILSTKPPKEYLSAKEETTSPLGKDSSDEEFLGKDTSEYDFYDKYANDELDDDDDYYTLSQKSGQFSGPEYKRLVAGKPVRGFHLSLDLETDEKVGRLTLSEQFAKEAASNENDPDPVRLTQKSTMRAFPKGTRVSSSKDYPSAKSRDRETTSIQGKDSSDEDLFEKDAPGDTPDQDFYDKCYMLTDYRYPVGCQCDHDEVDAEYDSDSNSQRSGQLAVPEYKRLVAMRGENQIRRHSLSLNPETVEHDSLGLSDQVLEEDGTGSVRFTQKSTMRVFPKGTRIASPKENPSAEHKDRERISPLGKDSSDGHFSDKDTPRDKPDDDLTDKIDNDEVNDDDYDSDTQSQKSYQSGPPEYKRLIAIHAGKPKSGLKQSLNPLTDKVGRLSLSEQLLEKAAADHGTDVIRFTQKNILRVFPKGTRFTSSNFEPLTAWMHGAQMVAFNMQGYGKFLWLMHGMFRSNGGCGYVKKPKFLLTSGPQGEVFDIKTPMPVTNILKVNVYLGDGWRLDFSHTHFDSYSPPDFYTKMYIVGVPADMVKKRTKIIEDDWGPIWDQEFEFPLTVPELALLRIEVREHDMSEKDDFGGQTCLPVSELRPGFRAVPLYDKKGEKLRSVRLLMRFHFV